MATRLYAPTLAGTLPAFSGSDFITIPFVMNRAVSAYEVHGFALKIKTVRSETYIGTIYENSNFSLAENSSVTFNLNASSNQIIINGKTQKITELLRIGQFYKLQLAYIDENGTVGYYSTLGLAKYTGEPTVTIQNLDSSKINGSQKQFTGLYNCSKDLTEKVYNYRFVISKSDNTVMYDTGYLLHNVLTDEYGVSTDVLDHEVILDENEIVNIQYFVTTINGLECASPLYTLLVGYQPHRKLIQN